MGGLTATLGVRFHSAGAEASTQSPLELRGPFRRGRLSAYYLRNVTAGILSGDTYRVDATAAAGSAVQVASSSATKVHAMPGGPARYEASLRAEPGGMLVWGPHTTILQEGSDLRQDLRVTLAPAACVILAEVLVLGRLARGERCSFRRFQSDLVVSNGTRELYEERYVLEPGATLGAALRGQGVVVSVYGLGAIADDAGERLRALVSDNPCVGVSSLPNSAGLVLRGLASSLSAGAALAEQALLSLRLSETSASQDPLTRQRL